MIITINGRPGSGKSTTTQLLAKALRFNTIDMGQVRRKAIRQSGMDFKEFNHWAVAHPEKGDRVFDRQLIKAVRGKKHVVVSSRTAFHFFPKAFNVFLDVNPREGAKRIFNDRKNRKAEFSKQLSLKEVQRFTAHRVREERQRYKKLYGLDIFDRKNYTFSLNTSHVPPTKVVQKLQAAYEQWKKTKR